MVVSTPQTDGDACSALSSESSSSTTTTDGSLFGLPIALAQESSAGAIVIKQTQSHINGLPLQPFGTRITRNAFD
jgi:hypothetical protein